MKQMKKEDAGKRKKRRSRKKDDDEDGKRETGREGGKRGEGREKAAERGDGWDGRKAGTGTGTDGRAGHHTPHTTVATHQYGVGPTQLRCSLLAALCYSDIQTCTGNR